LFIVRTPIFFCWFRYTLTFSTYENTKYNKIYEDRNVQSILSISDLIVNYNRLSDCCSTLKNIHNILTIDIVLIWKMYVINSRLDGRCRHFGLVMDAVFRLFLLTWAWKRIFIETWSFSRYKEQGVYYKNM